MTMTAAQVHNAGSGLTHLQAGEDFTLATVNVENSHDITWSQHNYHRQSSSAEVGTQISGGGAVSIQAQNDLNARAAEINAQGVLSLQSTDGNVNIEAGQSTEGIQTGSHLQAGGWLASKAVTQTSNTQITTAQASELGGQSVNISAGQDLRVQGSNVLADEDVVLAAQRDLTIEAAQNTQSSSNFNETKKSGLMSGGGLSVTIGKQVQSLDQGQQQTTAAASTVGSIGGNVSLSAGQTYAQSGSDVLSPAGDIDISAQTVNITEARETGSQRSEQKFKQSGLTVGLGGGIIDTAQASIQGLEGVVGGGSTRNQTLNALIAYGKSADLYEQGKAVQAAAGESGLSGAAAASGIKVSVSVGSSSSQSNSLTQTNTGAGSTVKAGGSVNIKATGQSVGEGDLTVQGSRVSAAKDVTLSATQDVNILASADTESNRSRNSSSSTSVGVSVGIGQGGAGLSLDVAASRGKGQGNSDSITYNNSLIEAGQRANITSGADTNVVGGNVKAQQVTANVGGNLNVESLQDTATSKADQKTTGIAVSIPIVGTGGSANLSQTQQKSRSNYASVNEQSGITAGDGGFQLNVGGNTDLKGAIIAGSSDASKNTLITQTLTTSDISNSMSASASSSGTSVGTNMMDGKYAMAKAVAGNLLNNGKASQSDASTTTSAISAAQVTVGGKTTDTSKDQLADSDGKAVSTDTSNTNRTLTKADVAGLQKSAQEQQASNMLAFNAATAFTDEAYRTMYKAGAQMYRVPPGCSDKSCAIALTEQEAMALKTSPQDGKVHISNNGIYNDLDGAVKYAQQHGGTMNEDGSKNYSNKPENQYIIFAPVANNGLSELIIAAVQKSGATPYVGLTNAEEQTAKIVQQTAQQGNAMVIDSHSRGTLTTDNALQSIINQGGITNEAGNTVKPNIQMNNYGGAQSNETGSQTLQQVTGNENAQINSVVHPRDLIGKTPVIVGGNQTNDAYASVTADGPRPPAPTTAKPDEERGPIANLINTFFGTASPHNCYGTAGKECLQQWDNIPKSNSPGITNPDYKAPVVIPQYQQVDKLTPQVQQSSNEQMNQLLPSPSAITTPTMPLPQPNDQLETLKNFKQEQ